MYVRFEFVSASIYVVGSCLRPVLRAMHAARMHNNSMIDVGRPPCVAHARMSGTTTCMQCPEPSVKDTSSLDNRHPQLLLLAHCQWRADENGRVASHRLKRMEMVVVVVNC